MPLYSYLETLYILSQNRFFEINIKCNMQIFQISCYLNMLNFLCSSYLLNILQTVYSRYYNSSMAERVPETSLENVTIALKILNLSDKDYLKDQQLMSKLSLMNGGPFDQQIFEEIWDQCKLNSKGEAKVIEFMEYIIEAEKLLIDKLKTLDGNIHKLQIQRKPNTNDYSDLKQYKEDLTALKEQKAQIKKSLAIIRDLFIRSNQHELIQGLTHVTRQKNSLVHVRQSLSTNPQQRPQNQLFEYDISKTPETLSKIVYLTLLLLFISWLGSQLFNRFLDMTLCMVVLLGYAMEAVNRKIIKLNALLLAASFFINIIWLILYIDKLWDPSHNYDFPVMNRTYLKLSIFLLFVSEFLKLTLCYYCLTQSHINQAEIFSISFFSKNLFMKNDPSPPYPNRHALSHSLRYVFNRAPPQVPAEQSEVKQ